MGSDLTLLCRNYYCLAVLRLDYNSAVEHRVVYQWKNILQTESHIFTEKIELLPNEAFVESSKCDRQIESVTSKLCTAGALGDSDVNSMLQKLRQILIPRRCGEPTNAMHLRAAEQVNGNWNTNSPMSFQVEESRCWWFEAPQASRIYSPGFLVGETKQNSINDLSIYVFKTNRKYKNTKRWKMTTDNGELFEATAPERSTYRYRNT